MDAERLSFLVDAGWRLTRDGSTATAQFVCEDPDEPDGDWEILVLHTAGHGARLTLNVDDSGLTERSLAEIRLLHATLSQAMTLAESWQGELPEDLSGD